MMNMEISPAGLELIRSFESFAATVYICPAGKRTVGYGHVVLAGEDFPNPISVAVAEDMLLLDCGWAEQTLTSQNFLLEQCEFDALVSFVFNVGEGNFARSTLRRLLAAGDKQGVAKELLRWNKGGGKVLSGLMRRRQAERAMFLGVPSV